MAVTKKPAAKAAPARRAPAKSKTPALPTEEDISGASKAEILELIEVHELDVEVEGKRVAELRDEVMELFFPTEPEEDAEPEEDEDETPAPRSKPKAKAKASAGDGEDPDWEELLNGLNASGGDVQFVKDGRTQLKLVLEDEDNRKSFYIESVRVYKGERRVKYLLRALMPKLDPPAIKAIPVGKTVLKAIFQLLVEGYDLLDADEGHGLTIVKRGSGFETSYNVMPSPKPVPMPESYSDLTTSLEDIAASLEESDINRDTGKDDDEDDKPKRGAARSAGKGRGRSKSDDDDEDSESW